MIVQQDLTDNFTILNNDVLNDALLTMEAKGVLCWLLSKPPNWIVNLEHMRRFFGCGRHKIQRIMVEMIEAGWVKRRPIRADGRGTFAGGDYLVFNVRQPVESADGEAAAPQAENATPVPQPAEPQADEPQAENGPAYQELSLPRTDSSEPKGSGTGKPAPDQRLVFSEGRSTLVDLGLHRSTAGAMIKKWLCETDDPDRVLAAIRSAHEHRVHSPIPWINTHLQQRQSHVHASGKSKLDEALAANAEWLRALEQSHAGHSRYSERELA